ncbi:hypothetical protein [Thalassotalea crassostreae]|nr:hypothetical protein [Thalassotalea crassostreae]
MNKKGMCFNNLLKEFSERIELAREYLKKIFLKISAGELSTRVLDNKSAI